MDLERFGIRAVDDRRTLAIGAALFGTISVAVFWQLFRDGGLTQIGQPLEGAHILAGCSMVSLVFAGLLDRRVLLRAVIAFPVVLLIGLAIVGLASGSWGIGSESEADRYGFLIGSYAALCASAAVLARRLGPVPLLVLIAAVAVVAGGMGLWAFATFRPPMTVTEEFQFVPAGPFLYKNALALVAAAALLPLGAGVVQQARRWPGVSVLTVSGVGLGVVTIVLALARSDFSIVLAGGFLVLALIWPGRFLATDRQRAIGLAVVVVVVGVAARLLFSGPLEGNEQSGTTRLLVIIAIAVATPALARGLLRFAPEVPDRVARGLVVAAVLIGVVFTVVVANTGQYGGGGDLTQTRQIYYEITIDTAKLEPVKGTGAGTFQEASLPIQDQRLSVQTRFAHSIPGEMWVELGLAGLVLSLLLYVAAFRASWRAFRVPLAALLIPLAVGFLLNGLIDWNWHYPAITALWALALGALTGVRIGDRETTDPGTDPAAEVSESSA